MLSVIIRTGGSERAAVATLTALVPGAAAGVVQDVVLVEPAPNPEIERVADVAGCRFLVAAGSRTEAFEEAARQSRAPWLLFLHAGMVPDSGWIDEAARFIQATDCAKPRAAVFRFAVSAFGEAGWRDRLGGALRVMGGPRAEQGLLIARDHYVRIGGHGAARSEAALLRKLGRARVTLRSAIVRV